MARPIAHFANATAGEIAPAGTEVRIAPRAPARARDDDT